MPTSVYGALHETKRTIGWGNCFKNNFVNADLCCIQCCQTCICLPTGFLSEGFSSSLKTLYLSPESRTKEKHSEQWQCVEAVKCALYIAGAGRW